MTNTQFEQELGYQSIMAICHHFLEEDTIRYSDFVKAEWFFFEKYRPIFRSF